MDWRAMPPLSALRAFSAFSQTGNVTQAGAALNVSHAAISQQLRALEKHLGVALFDRSGRALDLTEDGRQLARALDQGFATIGAAIAELTGADAARPVHVSTTPSFAAQWLMPRLAEFRAAFPGIDLMIDPTPRLAALTPGGIDIALRYGTGPWEGLESFVLLRSPMVVVAAPSVLGTRQVRAAEDLVDLPWLEELGTTEASTWLTRRVASLRITGTRTQMPGNLMLAAARDGQGVAVTVRHFVEPDLDAGRLVALFTEPGKAGYHVVTRPGPLRAPLRAFVTWLRRNIDAPDL